MGELAAVVENVVVPSSQNMSNPLTGTADAVNVAVMVSEAVPV